MHMSHVILFHFTYLRSLCSLLQWNWKVPFIKVVIIISDLKNVSFCLFNLLCLGSFDFESHWNTLTFFDKKRYGVIFEYVAGKNVWFCFISIVWVYFGHKTEKFWFWKSLNYFNVFLIKRMSDFITSCQTVSDLV